MSEFSWSRAPEELLRCARFPVPVFRPLSSRNSAVTTAAAAKGTFLAPATGSKNTSSRSLACSPRVAEIAMNARGVGRRLVFCPGKSLCTLTRKPWWLPPGLPTAGKPGRKLTSARKTTSALHESILRRYTERGFIQGTHRSRHPRMTRRSSSAVAGTELGLCRPRLQGRGLLLFRGQRKSPKAYSLRCFPPLAAFAANL